MKKLLALAVLGFLVPFSVLAQVPVSGTGEIKGDTLGTYLLSFIGFINNVLVPLIFAIAFIVFIWGIFQYFIAGGANEEKRDQGKQLAMWGIIAFVVMVSVWGIVNLLTATLNFEGKDKTPELPTFDVKKTS